MEKLSDFWIPYKGLSIGEHRYQFDVGESFFEVYKNSDINKASLQVELLLNKKETHIELNFVIEGAVVLTCDRCLEDMQYPLEIEQNLYIKFGDEFSEEDENLYVLPDSEDIIDISVFVDELITVAIPMRKVHEEDEEGNPTCPNNMFKYIENVKNSEGVAIDPRWNELNKLKNGTS